MLLSVFLFNTIGYYGLFLILKNQFNRDLTKKLDADEYSGNGTIIVKIPYASPYRVNFNAYERLDGEFECDGELYKLVKQKWVNDTLFIVLIKDHDQNKLNRSMADFTKANNDVPLSKSTSKLIQNFKKDFVSCLSQLEIGSIGWCRECTFSIQTKRFSFHYPSVLSPPPESALMI